MSFYNYHPKSTAKLGFPIDSRRPFEDKTTNGFLEWKASSTNNQEKGAALEFQIKEVSTREELYSKMSLDIKIESKFGLSNASASLEWEKELKFNEKTIVYVFSATRLYNADTMQGVLQFSESGKTAWKNAMRTNSILDFQRAVGNEVVTRVRRGNSISLVYSFNCTTVEMREQIKSKLQYGWSTGSVNVDFNKELKQIDESLTLNVYGFQSGVGTTKIDDLNLSEVIKVTPGDIVKIKEIVAKIVGDLSDENRENSPIVEFNTKQISDLPEILTSGKFYREFVDAIDLNSKIDEVCVQLNNLLLENIIHKDEVSALAKQWNQSEFKEGSSEVLKIKLEELITQRSEILNNFRQCINARTEKEVAVSIKPIISLKYSDVLILPFILPLSWENFITVYQEGFNIPFGGFTTYFYPRVHIKFPKAIKSVFIIKNDVRVKHINEEIIQSIGRSNGSFKDFWTTIQQDLHYHVWAWHAPMVEEARIELNRQHIMREASNKYQLEIVLDDGTLDNVDIGNASLPITLPKIIFANTPADLFAKFSAAGLYNLV